MKKRRIPSHYKVYYSYLDKFNFKEETITQDQIRLVYVAMLEDFLNQKTDLWELCETAGHLIHRLELLYLAGQEIDHNLHTSMEFALEMDSYLPNFIKDKKWDKLGEYFELVFDLLERDKINT